MKLSIEKHEKYIFVKLQEERLESLIAPQLKSELVYINTEGYRNVILDLSEVKYADSSGLSAILTGNRLSKSAGGTFVIAGPQESIQQLIEISQLDKVLNVLPTVEEATDFIFIEEIERDMQKEK